VKAGSVSWRALPAPPSRQSKEFPAMKKSMNAVSLSVTVHMTWASADTEKAALVKEASELFCEYLTGSENPFKEDYGPGAWGGYEGPFVTDVKCDKAQSVFLDNPVLGFFLDNPVLVEFPDD
jgi:hypothetical protein